MADRAGIVEVTESGTTVQKLQQVLHDLAARMDNASDRDYVSLAKQYCATAAQLDEICEEDADDPIDRISSKPERKPTTNKARGAELHRERSGRLP